MKKIQKMKAAQRLNSVAGMIEGVHQGMGTGKTRPNPMKSKRTNMTVKPVTALLSGRRRGPYNKE